MMPRMGIFVRRIGIVVGAATVLGVAFVGEVAAQDAAERRLSLREALSTALGQARGIDAGKYQLDGAQGELLAARSAYDTQLRTTLGDTRREARVLDGSGGVHPNPIGSRSTSYELALARELHGGIVVQPGLSIKHTDDPAAAPTAFTQAGAHLGVLVPLGANRFGRQTRSSQHVATLGFQAATQRFHQLVGEEVREVLSAYWEYRAADERREVYRRSEERAMSLLEETRTLVAADERPAADLNQVQANVASKRMSRLSSDQQLVAARQRLGLSLGLSADDARNLPLADEPFPAAAPFRASVDAVDRLVRVATAARPELAAAALQTRMAELLQESARAAGRPRLDLSLNLGYAGLTAGTDPGGIFSPLYRDIPGINAVIQVSYQGALVDREAQGRVLQRTANVQQQLLANAETRERIASSVFVAATGLERVLAMVAEAEVAIQMYELAVENEKRKYELGVATLLDLIMAQDNLTGVQLAGVDARASHALALATLRHATGTLVDAAGGDAARIAASAVSVP